MPSNIRNDSKDVANWEHQFANETIEGQAHLLANLSQKLIGCYSRLHKAGRLSNEPIAL